MVSASHMTIARLFRPLEKWFYDKSKYNVITAKSNELPVACNLKFMW